MYFYEVLCLQNLFFLMWCGSYVTATNAGELSEQTSQEYFLVAMIGLGIVLIIVFFSIYLINKQTVRQLTEQENRQGYLAFRFVNRNVVLRRQ
ncbi:uncharacterized protein LOC143461167 isoform X4 [Clavelina lepadiformis]|uniref:uncharacterized protein LOC143461167 isoform X4 n=1 Tax=Clavelina lepadiformis TaxID=159417 RepID=UPI0040416E85